MKQVAFAAIVIALVGLAGFVAARNLLANGTTGYVRVGSLVQGESETGTVSLDYGAIPSPGLGAWTVDVTFNPSVAFAVSCSPQHGGVCNPRFRDDAVRITGSTHPGLSGGGSLGTIEFGCEAAGQSLLKVHIEVLVDDTFGDPQAIKETVYNGTLTCEPAIPVGDVNCSGTVNALDALGVLQLGAGLIFGLPCTYAADVNGDHLVTPLDALFILQFDAGLIVRLGPPTPTPVPLSPPMSPPLSWGTSGAALLDDEAGLVTSGALAAALTVGAMGFFGVVLSKQRADGDQDGETD